MLIKDNSYQSLIVIKPLIKLKYLKKIKSNNFTHSKYIPFKTIYS